MRKEKGAIATIIISIVVIILLVAGAGLGYYIYTTKDDNNIANSSNEEDTIGTKEDVGDDTEKPEYTWVIEPTLKYERIMYVCSADMYMASKEGESELVGLDLTDVTKGTVKEIEMNGRHGNGRRNCSI